MRQFIIVSVIFFIEFSSVHSQSLKSISENKNLVLTDSIYLNSSDSALPKRNYNVAKEVAGNYATFSSGLMTIGESKNAFYISLDANSNLFYYFYLNYGIYGLFGKGAAFACHITPGIGIDIIPHKLFTFAGFGYFFLAPFYLGTNIALRVNYKFTKELSAGLDNKLIFSGHSGGYPGNLYTVGLNFSYKFNF